MNQPILSLITDYKEHLKEDGLSQELYKWDLVKKYKGRPHLDVEDFEKEIRSIEYGNLIYGMADAVKNHLRSARPEEYRECNNCATV